MFTGLVQQVGTLRSIEFEGECGRLRVAVTPWDRPLVVGESVAVQGACLTAVDFDSQTVVFDVLRETFGKTCLGGKPIGARLNLERALRMGDPLGGHIVTGHVDGVGRVAGIDRAGRDRILRIACAPDLASMLVSKGSIAIDGVSLTLVEIGGDGFSVHIIPHTWERTALGDLGAGASVNLETDILGKYVARLLQRPADRGEVTWDKLRACGFAG